MSSFQLGEARKARAAALCEAAESELARVAPDFLEKFPLEVYINELNYNGHFHRYWDVTSKLRDFSDAMTAAYPSQAVELYNRLLLAHLIRNAENRNTHNIVGSVAAFVHEDFDRILSGLERPRAGYYLRSVHLFRRDLAIARMKVIPNGAEFIDINIGIPRRETWHNGVRSFISHGRIFQSDFLHGLSPLYEPHWDRRYIRHFSAEGYKAFYRRTAELLRANPEVRGVAAKSWWLDPAIADISPEIAFLRADPEAGGARFAPVYAPPNPYLKTEPFVGSPKRKALHEAGRYNPRSFMFFWSRDRLLRWAASQTA
jgi:hypothetical protein